MSKLNLKEGVNLESGENILSNCNTHNKNNSMDMFHPYERHYPFVFQCYMCLRVCADSFAFRNEYISLYTVKKISSTVRLINRKDKEMVCICGTLLGEQKNIKEEKIYYLYKKKIILYNLNRDND